MMFGQSGLGMAVCSRSPILLTSSFTCYCLFEQGIQLSCVELTPDVVALIHVWAYAQGPWIFGLHDFKLSWL